MIESIIIMLIYVCILAVVLVLAIYVLRDVVGLPIPPKVIQIIWVIFALIVILWVARVLLAGGALSLPGIIGFAHLFGV